MKLTVGSAPRFVPVSRETYVEGAESGEDESFTKKYGGWIAAAFFAWQLIKDKKVTKRVGARVAPHVNEFKKNWW